MPGDPRVLGMALDYFAEEREKYRPTRLGSISMIAQRFIATLDDYDLQELVGEVVEGEVEEQFEKLIQTHNRYVRSPRTIRSRREITEDLTTGLIRLFERRDVMLMTRTP